MTHPNCTLNNDPGYTTQGITCGYDPDTNDCTLAGHASGCGLPPRPEPTTQPEPIEPLL